MEECSFIQWNRSMIKRKANALCIWVWTKIWTVQKAEQVKVRCRASDLSKWKFFNSSKWKLSMAKKKKKTENKKSISYEAKLSQNSQTSSSYLPLPCPIYEIQTVQILKHLLFHLLTKIQSNLSWSHRQIHHSWDILYAWSIWRWVLVRLD